MMETTIVQCIGETPRSDRSRAFSRILIVTIATLGFLAIAQSIHSKVMAAEQLTFSTPDAAVDALVAAVAADDVEKLLDIFGREYESDLIGGDEIAFRETRKILARALAEAASLHDGDMDTKTLIVGAKAWPFPFPIVRHAGVWRFDTAAGVEEVINRRIGRNELDAIELCRAYVDAQVQYADADHDGDDVREFAQKILSEEGQKDGLYWKFGDGETLSPFGPLVADARNYLEGREVGDPFKGYYYRVITRQSAEAPGGRYDYIINGNMIAGFALIAFPADYGNSGIMSFICNHQGKVYQTDLGEDGDLIAGGMIVYNPDSTWSEVR
jgi:hypothetical protein